MTNEEIEKDADECWFLWKKTFAQKGIDVAKFTVLDVWHHAYRAGIELGRELERSEVEAELITVSEEQDDMILAQCISTCAVLVGSREDRT